MHYISMLVHRFYGNKSRDEKGLYIFIDNAMTENDELTSKMLKEMLVKEWPDLSRISLSMVKRAR